MLLRGLFPACGERGPSPVAVHRCLRLVPPLGVEQGFGGTWSSVAVERGLSCSSERGIFPRQGPNPHPLHRQVDPYPQRHRGSPVSPLPKSSVVGLGAQTRGSRGSGLSPTPALGSVPRTGSCPAPHRPLSGLPQSRLPPAFLSLVLTRRPPKRAPRFLQQQQQVGALTSPQCDMLVTPASGDFQSQTCSEFRS